MKVLYKSALRKAPRFLAPWLLLIALLPAGMAYARQAPASASVPQAFSEALQAAAPAAFNKTGPGNGTTGNPLTVTLQWTPSVDATTYELCRDQDGNNVCNSGWTDVGSVTSLPVGPLLAGTTYSWNVRAVNATGTTYSDGSTNFWSFMTGAAPAAFSKSTPTDKATSQPLSLNLTWGASTGASSYAYCLDADTNTVCDSGWNNVGNVLTTSVGPLSPGTTYSWHVLAVNDFGTTYSGGAATTFRTFTTLDLPGAFSRSAPGNGSTVLSPTPNLVWGTSAGADYYEYCLDADITPNSTCDTGWINVGNVTTYQVGPLNASTIYYWHVRAVNGAGTTYAGNAPANFFSFTTAQLPGPFGKSSPATGAANQLPTVNLTWGASAGADSYEYCIDTISNDICNTSWNNVGTNLSASPALSPGITYYWHVRARNLFGTTDSDGSPTIWWTFTTGSAPGSFSKTSPSNGAGNQFPALDLVWGASTDADTYEYCYDATNDDACTPWTSTTATSVSLANLVAGTTYYWHVRAVNAYGTTYSNGFLVNDWSFTIGSAPTTFGKSSPTGGATEQSINPTLQWSASTNFDRYEYCYDTSNNGVCNDTWQNAGSLTSVTIGPLLENTLYSWQVRALNVYGITYANGLDTAFRAFTTGILPGAFNKSTPANGAVNRPVSLNLTWVASSGTNVTYAYCLQLSTAACDPASPNWTDAGTLTSVPVSLTPATTYYWHVRAVNNAGTTYSGGSPTAFFSFTTGTPPAPFGKSTPANGATGRSLLPTLIWGTSTGAASYSYCYDTLDNGLCDGNWINVGTSTSDTITSPLSTGTTYYWHVRAQNSFGITYSDGASTAWWPFTTGFPPAAFDKTAPSSGAVNRSVTPTLQWQASASASSYAYCLDTTNDGSCTGWSNVGSVTSFQVGPLAPGTTFFWHIRAINNFGTTYSGPTPGTSAFWSFTTGPAPDSFARTAPANGATGLPLDPDLTWTATTGVDSYQYCYSTSSAVTVASCAPWTDAALNTTVSLSSLSQYTTYYWHVRAVNAFGVTYADDSTAFFSFTTGGVPGPFSKISPPDDLTVARPLNTSLSWAPSSTAIDYEYCLATSRAACTNWTSTAGAASVSPAGLAPSTFYYWHVRAVNSFGATYSNGSETASWSFITAAICPAITGWRGQYWRNETFTGPAVLCRDDGAVLNRDFQYNSPGPKIPVDHFSARWTRSVNFPTGGVYRFSVDHDDGARLYVDGVLKGTWWDTCCTVDWTDVTLTAGNHTLRLDYREVEGAASIHLWWEQLNAQFISLAAEDGFVLESLETSNVGGSINASSTTFFLGDDAADRQYRSILSFNTSGLPDNAVIISATLKIKGAGVVGTNPFTTHGSIMGDVRMGVFGTSASLQAADFQALSSRDNAFSIANNPVSGWYSGKSAVNALGFINRTGRTQIRLRFQLDDNDDRAADYMKFYSSNYSTVASRPLLIIVYYIP